MFSNSLSLNNYEKHYQINKKKNTNALNSHTGYEQGNLNLWILVHSCSNTCSMFEPVFTHMPFLILIQSVNMLPHTLTLDIKHPFHADLMQSLLSKLSTNAEHLVSVWRHHSDAALVQLAPGHWPLLAQLLHPLHNLKYLRWRSKVRRRWQQGSNPCSLHTIPTYTHLTWK